MSNEVKTEANEAKKEVKIDPAYQGYVFLGWASGLFELKSGEKRPYRLGKRKSTIFQSCFFRGVKLCHIDFFLWWLPDILGFFAPFFIRHTLQWRGTLSF